MATNPASGEQLQVLAYKTWVLKVSIHCEGCKKKVKKVLHSVEGVYDTNIDSKQHKVTVTGYVEADTLINKLVKSGKNAKLWPEPIMKKEKKLGKLKKKEKQIDPKTKGANQEEGNKEPEEEKLVEKVEGIPREIVKKIEVNPAQVPEKSENSGTTVKIPGSNVKDGGDGEVAETKADRKKLETSSASNQLPEAEAEKISGESEPIGNVNKSKKNKGQKHPAEVGTSTAGAPTFSESAHPVLMSHSPPRYHGYQYPPHCHDSPPIYSVSYNAAHPSSSYMASYYASPPPYSYACTHTGIAMQPQPLNLDSYHLQPLDSFEMFSDENPNGCFIM